MHEHSLQEQLEDHAAIIDALPFLQDLHTNKLIIEANLPSDAPCFPEKNVAIQNFYMNRGDPPALGVWAIQVDGSPYARLQTAPSENGIAYKLTTGIKGDVHPANHQEEHAVAVLLTHLREQYAPMLEQEKANLAQETPRKNRLAFLGCVVMRMWNHPNKHA